MTSPSDRLDAYFQRIGLTGAPSRDAAGLTQWLAAHRQAIAFENLDIPLGRGIAIDVDRVFDKLVTRRRGGYCFEQNRLFSDMLALAGVSNRPLLARVRLMVPEFHVPPRTHVLLVVDLGGESWIADAGFGGSFVPPLRLEDGAQASTPDGARHRLLHLGSAGGLDGEWRLERAGPGEATDGRFADHGDWQPQYTFDLAEVAPDDLEQCNHWTSTRPGTRFTTLHIVSRVLPDGFASLSDRKLTVYRAGEAETRSIESAADYAAVLADRFGLALPEAKLAQLSIFANP